MLRSVALQKVPDVLEVFAASIVKAYRLLVVGSKHAWNVGKFLRD
jgi:hypothetical protein